MNIFIIIYFVSIVGAIIYFAGQTYRDGRLLLGESILMLAASVIPIINTLLLISLLDDIVSSDTELWRKK